MTDITQEISNRVYNAIKKNLEGKPRLSRIGASQVGTPCLRRLNYDWRGVKQVEFDGRILRLFETGKLQEDRILADLRAAGFAVWDKDEEGNQFVFTDETGHAVAKVDGIIKGLPGSEDDARVLEIKTHSKKSFDDLLKLGVAKAKPEHFYQLQAGMMFSGIPYGLYVALCKDDERYYFEPINVSEYVQQDITRRVAELLESEFSPLGISDNPKTGFGCKFCDFQDICVGEAQPARNCRTCINSTPHVRHGIWLCSLTGTELTAKEQLAGCEHYVSRF